MDASAVVTAGLGVRDRAALVEALSREAGALAALLRALDAEEAGRPVPGLDWTVGETAAHVVTVVRRALGDRRRSSDPAATAALNAVCLEEYAERDPRRLADELAGGVAVAVGTVLPGIPDDDLLLPFHGGTTIRLLSGFGVILAELLVHGRDIAAAVGRPWPIPPGDAALAVQAMLEVAHAWADPTALPDRPTEHVLRLPPPFPSYRVVAGPAGLQVTAAPEPVVSPEGADPAGILLALSRRAASADPDVQGVARLILPL